jgi:hypothetical protein
MGGAHCWAVLTVGQHESHNRLHGKPRSRGHWRPRGSTRGSLRLPGTTTSLSSCTAPLSCQLILTCRMSSLGCGPLQVVDPHADHLRLPQSKEERAVLQAHAQAYIGQIGELLVRIPRPLLLLLKTNDCLRAVDNTLGQPTNTIAITARECTRALAEREMEQHPGLLTWVGAQAQLLHVEALMLAMSAASWWLRLRAALFGPPPRRKEPLPEGFQQQPLVL